MHASLGCEGNEGEGARNEGRTPACLLTPFVAILGQAEVELLRSEMVAASQSTFSVASAAARVPAPLGLGGGSRSFRPAWPPGGQLQGDREAAAPSRCREDGLGIDGSRERRVTVSGWLSRPPATTEGRERAVAAASGSWEGAWSPQEPLSPSPPHELPINLPANGDLAQELSFPDAGDPDLLPETPGLRLGRTPSVISGGQRPSTDISLEADESMRLLNRRISEVSAEAAQWTGIAALPSDLRGGRKDSGRAGARAKDAGHDREDEGVPVRGMSGREQGEEKGEDRTGGSERVRL